MSDPQHPTVAASEMFDPEIHPPPKGANLLLVTEGGTLTVGPWSTDCIAWGFKPKIPESVKARQRKKLKALKDQWE